MIYYGLFYQSQRGKICKVCTWCYFLFNLDIPAKQILWFSCGATKELLIYFPVLLNPIGLEEQNISIPTFFLFPTFFLSYVSKGA
jgi:hypothetical protein